MSTTLRMRIMLPTSFPAAEGVVTAPQPSASLTPLSALAFLFVSTAAGAGIVSAALIANYPPVSLSIIGLGALCSLSCSAKAARWITSRSKSVTTTQNRVRAQPVVS